MNAITKVKVILQGWWHTIFKNKKIEEVYKLDPQYIKWCLKNSQYLSDSQKELMNSLVNSRSDGA